MGILTCVHRAGGDVVNADATGLEFLADTTGLLSVSMYICMYNEGRGNYRVKCSTGALLPAYEV